VTEKVWESEMVPVTVSEDVAKKPAVQPSAPPPAQPKAGLVLLPSYSKEWYKRISVEKVAIVLLHVTSKF